MKFLILLPFLLFIAGASHPIHAQGGDQDMNLLPENYFDFWVGDWNVSWIDRGGRRGYGFNRVRRIMNGKVIFEQFEATAGELKGYEGRSFTVYLPSTGEWKQTWVDNEGDYLDFTGAVDGDKRIFTRKMQNEKGGEIIQRMVFYDINEESFTWDWQVSENSGKSWRTEWQIYYFRQMPDHE